jgi:hypothetical protein
MKKNRFFIKLTPGANVINFFTVVSYEFLLKGRVFSRGKPFQPSLLFVGKVRSLP